MAESSHMQCQQAAPKRQVFPAQPDRPACDSARLLQHFLNMPEKIANLECALPFPKGGLCAPLHPCLDGGARHTSILVVDDEDILSQILKQMLESQGYAVILAADCREARQLCSRPETRIDLLLTDIKMPGESGPQLATALRLMRPSLKVLYMSANSVGELQLEGLLDARYPVTSGSSFILKPFHVREICRALRQLLDSQPAARAGFLSVERASPELQ